MSESRVEQVARAWSAAPGLPVWPLSRPRYECGAIAALVPILLCVALWNRFPIIFYDTGAYILQGLGGTFLMERSPVYSLFLRYASASSTLWYVVVVQALMTAVVLVELARAEAPDLSFWRFMGIGTALSLLTGLPWYVGQIEPDFMTALVSISLYLISFRSARMGRFRVALLTGIAALSIAAHPSHLGLGIGLFLCIACTRLASRLWSMSIPRPAMGPAALSLALGLGLVLAANYHLTGQIFVNRSGAVFLSARMMQDGIVKRLLDETCPAAGYRMCAYRDRLPPRADAWLWERISPFNYALGGFKGMAGESGSIVRESLRRYPWWNLKAAVEDAALQFILVQTGDGIDPQEWVLDTEFKHFLPRQLAGYLEARQQRGEIRFLLPNLVHVSVAILSFAGLIWLIRLRLRQRRWDALVLPAAVLLTLIGNALICGVFSGPHGRYQSRIAWMPTCVLLLDGSATARFALRKQIESGT